MQLVYGHDEKIAAWVSAKLEDMDFGLCTAIGAIHKDKLVFGVVFNNYHESPQGEPISIEASVVVNGHFPCTKNTLKEIFSYPFNQLGVKRISLHIAKSNKKARTQALRLGFRLEGIARQGCVTGGDAAVYSILKPECKWIYHVPRSTQSTSSPRSGGYFSGANAIKPGNGSLQLWPQ